MKTPPVEGWTPVRISYPVRIPTADGLSVAETIEVEVDAWRDADGQTVLDGDAREVIEAVKARYLGLLAPADIRQLREALRLTQNEISDLLQIGARTWSRWENGRERPSRSTNVLLQALCDGRVDINYLRLLRQPVRADAFIRVRAAVAAGRNTAHGAYRLTDDESAASFACTPSDEAVPA